MLSTITSTTFRPFATSAHVASHRAPSARAGAGRVLAWAAACWMATASLALAQDVAIRAQRVVTMAGDDIADGVVIVRDGKITAVGPASATPVPAGMRVLEAAVATPGLIDARATVGVSGMLNQRQDQDQLERSAPIQPELRAIDAYNPLDPLVAYLRGFGITTVHTGHAPGELISGQTAIVKTVGNTVEDAVIVPEAMIAATVGPWAQRSGGSAPGTRAKMAAMLRDQLLKAQDYRRKLDKAAQAAVTPPTPPTPAADSAPSATDPTTEQAPPEPEARADADATPPDRDLRLEALVRVLRREVPLLVTVNRAQDIALVLRLAEEFNIRIVLDSASEAYLLTDRIKAAGVPVLVHPTMARAFGEMENKSFETAGMLRRAGVPVAIQGGYEAYVPKSRVILFEAQAAAQVGNVSPREALSLVTIDAARVLGIADRVGSLEAGKDGDVALFSGDPLEYTSRCVGVVIDGRVVSERAN